MHTIEPHYTWRHIYTSEEDRYSPFYGKEYSEFEFSDVIYNHYIHPQWDNIGSSTLYAKILYCNYEEQYCIIELIGEWNDCLYNDIMYLKRNIIDSLVENGINQFILVGENVLNFHADDTDYYQEWFDDIEDGWVALVNFRDHVIQEIEQAGIDYYVAHGGHLNNMIWRSQMPDKVYSNVKALITRRLPV